MENTTNQHPLRTLTLCEPLFRNYDISSANFPVGITTLNRNIDCFDYFIATFPVHMFESMYTIFYFQNFENKTLVLFIRFYNSFENHQDKYTHTEEKGILV